MYHFHMEWEDNVFFYSVIFKVSCSDLQICHLYSKEGKS